jgi:protein-disulfide isomerase
VNRFYLLLGVVAAAAVLFIVFSANQPAGITPRGQAPTVAVTAADSAFRGYPLGSDSAPVKIVEYVDYECPICANFATVQFPTIKDQLIRTGKVQWRLRDYPLPPATHRWSHLAAGAVACASEQGKAWEMVDAVFNNHGWALKSSNPTGVFHDLAKGIGVNTDSYDACVSSDRYAGRIQASSNEGDALGVGGTPTIYIDGRELKGLDRSSDRFQQVVDSIIGSRRK